MGVVVGERLPRKRGEPGNPSGRDTTLEDEIPRTLQEKATTRRNIWSPGKPSFPLDVPSRFIIEELRESDAARDY